MKVGRSTLYNCLIIAIYALLILSGIKQFSIWNQILDLADTDIGQFTSTLSPHLLRFIVVLPVILFARAVNVSQEFVFSCSILALTVGLVFMMARSMAETVDADRTMWVHYYRWLAIPMFAVTLLMNGRIVIAMFGLMLLVSSQVTWYLASKQSFARFCLAQAIGLFLLNVSSGTVIVGVVCFFAFTMVMPLSRYPDADRRHLPLLIVSVVLLTLLSPFLYIGVVKNLDFYGGGLVGFTGMLQHGFGKFLPDDVFFHVVAILLSLLWFGVIFQGVISIYRGRKVNAPVVIATFASLPLGAFGFSTLLVGLPLWVCAGLMVYRFKSRGLPLSLKQSPS